MLKVLKEQKFSNEQSKIAPEIYIDSVEIEENNISIFFHIEDSKFNRDFYSRWIANEYVLENLYVNIICNNFSYKRSLRDLKNKNKIIDYKIYDSITFKNDKTGNLFVKAYCSDKQDIARGESTTEKILINNLIPNAFYENTKYTYINKIKDLRDLELTPLILNKVEKPAAKDNSKDLYISYQFGNKRANVAYIFDIDSFLDNNSHSYRILKKYKLFKDIIISKSHIIPSSLYFSKKIYSNAIEDTFKSFGVKPKILKVNQDEADGKYIITCSDEVVGDEERRKFLVKLSFDVYDFSKEFVKKEIIGSLRDARAFIVRYKEKFSTCFQNSSIENPREYFFEQHYERDLENIEKTINNLSNFYSFYTGKDIKKYKSLFLSILHPLTTRASLLDKFLNKLYMLEKAFSSVVDEINALGDPGTSFLIETKTKFEYEFKTNNVTGVPNYIDYDYNTYDGYEVLRADSREKRLNDLVPGLKTISAEEFNTRKDIESTKFFETAEDDISSKIRHFSISYLDRKNISYDFLTSFNIEENMIQGTSANFLFSTINDINSNKLRVARPRESMFLQLAEQNIYIKSLGTSKNISKNKKNISILFDSNADSRNDSAEYIDNTGISTLYGLIDKSKILDIPRDKNIIQREAAFPSTITLYPTKYGLSTDILNDPDQKAIIIFLYNNFFAFREVISGTNYSIHELEETLVNPIFKGKLRFFNKYYIVKYNNNENTQSITLRTVDQALSQEIKYNTPSYYLNREISKEQLLLTTSDL